MNIWRRVDALVERAAKVSDLHRHRLHLYAAWRWRSLGRAVPDELLTLERGATAVRLAIPGVVRRVREAYDGPMALLKGADVAAYYPRPELRPVWDLDLLVLDADYVHRKLLDFGFAESTSLLPAEHHHLQPLVWPGFAGNVEIHSAPNWPLWLVPPRVDELLAVATTESALGHGILALPPAHHAIVLAAHLWRDDPMGRLGQLLDMCLMAEAAEPGALDSLVRRWGVERLWRTTQAAAARVLRDEQNQPLGVRMLTQSLESMRERTLIESRFFEVSSPFFAFEPTVAVATAVRNVLPSLQPAPNESWGTKLRRTPRRLRQSFWRVSATTDTAPDKTSLRARHDA